MSRGSRRPARGQQGFALLVTLLVLVVGMTSFFLAAGDPAAEQQARRSSVAAAALAQARELVLARALADINRPGSIPCAAPDTGGSGTFSGNDCDANVGRLPYRTLDTPPLRDAGGELLWYAIDPSLRDRASQEPVNPEDKPGSLSVNGQGNFAAVVIAPGDALAGQDRAAGSRGDFLEGGNGSGFDFTDCTGDPDCNDRVRGISTNRLFDAVQRRVLALVAEELVATWESSAATQSQRYLPYAAAFGADECENGRELGRIPTADTDSDCGGLFLDTTELPSWVTDNGWLDLVVYRVDSDCTRAERNCSAATLLVNGTGTHQAVVAGAGRPLGAQTRPGTGVAEFLEDNRNLDMDDAYADTPLTSSDNDVLNGVTLP